jgi:prolyl oligopeptidase
MKKITFLLIILGLLTMAGCKQNATYPVAQKGSVVDDYFGTKIADPYRWMENDTTKEVADWVKAENELTFNYL